LFIGFSFLALLALLAGAMLLFLGKGDSNDGPVEVQLVRLLTDRDLAKQQLPGEEFVGDPTIVLADRRLRLVGSVDPKSDAVAHRKT
jgi:hypothetical protein